MITTQTHLELEQNSHLEPHWLLLESVVTLNIVDSHMTFLLCATNVYTGGTEPQRWYVQN